VLASTGQQQRGTKVFGNLALAPWEALVVSESSHRSGR
jgi:hypothetical protein